MATTDDPATGESEPDARFTYANERTFLAWNRTALALIATGVAATQLLPEFHVNGGRRILGLPMIGLGALVAGSRAGLVYNTWPLMDGRFAPPFDNLTRLAPPWRNFFENIDLVQLDHRLAAYALLAFALWHAFAAWRVAPGSKAAKRAMAVAGMVAAQAGLGIMTLLLAVPVWAGLLHQAFAMAVLSMATVHRARFSF